MGAAKWWSLWAVFNLFFLSWLFDWSKLAKEWAVQRKEDRRQKRVAAVLAAPVVRPRRNASLPKEGPYGPYWTMDRLRHGGSVRIVAAGLSRSGSTWQFNALRILLQHAAKAIGQPENLVQSAHGHSVDDLQACLTHRVCIVKVHEFLPRVLNQVDAVFVTHRDPRDVLLSSAQKIEACLLAGKQPLESAFRSYAAWVPHACHDMRYERMATGGAAQELHLMAIKLGIADAVNLVDVAAQLGQVTHRAEPNTAQQVATGLMPGHLTHLTTDPGAHLTFEDAVARGAFSKKCNLTREIELINAGFGRWLAKEGYPLPPQAGVMPQLAPPPKPKPQPTARAAGRRAGKGSGFGVDGKSQELMDAFSNLLEEERAAEELAAEQLEREEAWLLSNRVAWRGDELTNWYIDALPERAWLMRPLDAPQPSADGGGGGTVQQCPLRSGWSTMLDRSGVWRYSVPGGKAGSQANAPLAPIGAPVEPQQQRPPRLPGNPPRPVIKPAAPVPARGKGPASPQAELKRAMEASAHDAKALAAKAAVAAREAQRTADEEQDSMAELDRQGRPRLQPTFMLIGTPRAGTTVLYDSLTGNDPNVVSALTKEINYFNSDGWNAKPVKWYNSQFKRRKQPNQITGDGSCTSVLCPKVAERVKQRAPSITKLLMCVRDEVRRLQSHYRMCKQNEQVEIKGELEPKNKGAPKPGKNAKLPPLPPLADIVRRELAHVRSCDAKHASLPLEERYAVCYINATATCAFSSALLPTTLHNSNRPGCGLPGGGGASLLAGSMYALQLAPWLKAFSPSQLLLVQKADLEHKPRVTLENVSAFIGSSHRYRDAKDVKGGATKKPKRRSFSGDGALDDALKAELVAFFVPHRERLGKLLKERQIHMTRFTETTQAEYLVPA